MVAGLQYGDSGLDTPLQKSLGRLLRAWPSLPRFQWVPLANMVFTVNEMSGQRGLEAGELGFEPKSSRSVWHGRDVGPALQSPCL